MTNTLRGSLKSLRPLRWNRRFLAFLTVLFTCSDQDRSCVMVFETVHPLHLRPADAEWMDVTLLLPPVVHNQLLSFAGVQQEVILLAPALQVDDLLPVGLLLVMG